MPDNRVQVIIEGIDRASKVFEDLKRQVITLKSEADKAGGGVGESFGKSKVHVESLNDQFAKMKNQIMAIAAAWKLFDIAKDSILLASRVETLSAVLEVMGKNVNLTGAEMNAYVGQVKAMGITTEASQQTVIRMVQAQLDLSKANQLARVAQDAAVIGNVNSSEALERMIHGIVTLQPEILRTIGITVNFENEYKKAGATLGKNMDQLSQTEKQQIAMNAVLTEGIKIQGAYEAAMGTAGKQLKSMERYTEELKLKTGDIAGGAFTAIILEIVDSLKTLDQSLSSMKDSGSMAEMSDDLQFGVLVALNDIKTLATDVWNILKEFGPAVKFFLELIIKALDGWGYIYAAMKPVSELFGKLIAMATNFYQILLNAGGVMASIAKKDWEGMKKYASNVATAAKDMAVNAVDAAGKAKKLPDSVSDSLSAREQAKQTAKEKVAAYRAKKEYENSNYIPGAGGIRKPTYKPEDATSKKGGKGADNAVESWASKIRDLDTDMQKALYPHDELARKLEDIKNKYDDLIVQAQKYAKEHKRTFDTAKVEEWRKIMEKAARDADAEKKLKAWADVEQQITERIAPELQKRLAAEDKFVKDSEEKLKKAGFTQEEITEKMVNVTQAAAEKKKKIELDYINTIKEAESRRYLSELDMMEKNRIGSKSDIARERIAVYESLLQSYQRNWENEADPTAKIIWADKIDETRSKLVEVNIVLRDQQGLLKDGLGQGLKDYLWEMKSVFQQGVDIARQTAQGMETAFSDFFFDTFQGKLKSFGDYIQAFATSVQRSIANALGGEVSGGIMKGISSLFRPSTAASGSNSAAYSSFASNFSFLNGTQQRHGGGTVRRYVPVFHAGGLNSDERVVINKVGERYITEEQNAWLTKIARTAEGPSNTTIIFEPGPGLPALKGRELSSKRDNRGEVKRILIELAGTDPAVRAALGVK